MAKEKVNYQEVYDGGSNEIEYECGEYVFQADRLPFPPHFFLFLLHPYKSKHQRNRYDCQRPRQLHDGRIFQYRAVRTVQRIPGGGRRRNGGGIVDRSSRKEPEARVSQPKYLSQRGENKRRYYIKKENNGYGLGDFFIVRVNDRRCGRNGRTAADAGADADKSRRLARNLQKPVHEYCNHQGCGDCGNDNGEGSHPHLPYRSQIQAEAQKDYRILQNFLGGKGDASTDRRLIPAFPRLSASLVIWDSLCFRSL